MAEPNRSQSFMDKVWELFISLKLAISVLIILAVASIIGTIIEQNQPPEHYRKLFGEGTIRFLDMLNVFDMYHSWWFLFLLVLFTVNLSCCTIDRLPRVLRVVRNPKRTLDESLEKSLSQVERWKKKGAVDALAAGYEAALAASFGKPVLTENSETRHLYAERGVVSRFGVYVTHLSIVIIFIGAIVGTVTGFKGYANIVEGEAIGKIPVRGGTREVDLGFLVRCNRFNVDFYPNGQPKEYASDLSVFDGGREVLRKKIVVNDPLVYKGVWFYQSSYGRAPGSNVVVGLTRASGGPTQTIPLSQGQIAEVPGYAKIAVHAYEQNFQGFGPAILVHLEKPGKPAQEFWLIKAYADFDRQRKDDYVLSFAAINESFYTGLQVAKDPGVNVVWLGCTLMTVGIVIAFFMSHQRIWVRLSPAPDGRVEVVVAGAASRNRLAFERKFERILADIKAAGA